MREMKDSGVQWIGTVPACWNMVPTKHLFQVVSGATPQAGHDEYWDGDIIWVTPADFKTDDRDISKGKRTLTQQGVNSCSTTLVPAGSLIFSKRAPIGAVVVSSVDLCTNQGCLSSIPYNFEQTCVRYFYYVMAVATEQYELLGSGTTFKEISATNFSNFVLPVPVYEEQQQIVAHLDTKCSQVDTLIANVQAQIEKLKAYKQSVITEAVTRGIDPSVPMKDSGIQWLPTMPIGWKLSRIKNEIIPLERPVLADDEVITCFRDGVVTLRRRRREDGFTVSFTEHGYQGVEIGDLVIHGMDTFAGAIGCSDSRGKTTPVVHVCRTTGNNRYFMYFLRSMAYNHVYMDFSNGVRIRSSDFRNFAKLAIFDIIVPPLDEQDAIVEYLDSKSAQINRLLALKQTTIDKLNEYKKSLIYEYVTGKKEV